MKAKQHVDVAASRFLFKFLRQLRDRLMVKLVISTNVNDWRVAKMTPDPFTSFPPKVNIAGDNHRIHVRGRDVGGAELQVQVSENV